MLRVPDYLSPRPVGGDGGAVSWVFAMAAVADPKQICKHKK